MSKGKLQKAAENLEFTRRIIVNLIWIGLIIIILSAAGWFLVGNRPATDENGKSLKAEESVKPVAPAVNWSEVDSALAEVLKKAARDARSYADKELNGWIGTMMGKVDNSFLDWYFSYYTQQMLGLKGLYQYGVHYVIEQQPTASEKLTQEIQQEFSQRVLQPQIAERVLERVVNQTAKIYVDVLNQGLDEIPQTYSVNRAEWQEYLQDIAITVQQAEGSRQTPLTLKALTVSGAGGAAVLATNMKSLLSKVGSKVLAKSSGKVASSMAAKTGGKVVAKVGGKFFGAIAGFGVLVWDIWDHKTTEKENRPFLRLALRDYFSELKSILLDDPEYGIMSTFQLLEQEVVRRSDNPV